MKPTMFVASSVEGIAIAKSIQQNLQHSVDVTLWNQSMFPPSSSTLGSLLTAAKDFDFGLFVFSPDDRVTSRKEVRVGARDNVLFECGLFFGHLGQSRSLFLMPSIPNFKVPSDLYGITPLKYSPGSHRGNLCAMTGAACAAIEDHIKNVTRAHSPHECLSGEWVQLWKPHQKTSYPKGSKSNAIVKHLEDEFYATCLDGKHTFTVKGRIEKGCFVTGTWSNPKTPSYYSGAFQLRVSPKLDRMEGVWVGHRSDNTFGTGSWQWNREARR